MNFIYIKIIFFLFPLFQSINIDSLKKDPTMVQYKKIMNEIKEGVYSKKYKLPVNAEAIQKELAKNPSKELMKKLYKDGGMVNAEEYIDKITLQTTLMFEFLKKHPEIAKLDQNKKMELLMKLLKD